MATLAWRMNSSGGKIMKKMIFSDSDGECLLYARTKNMPKKEEKLDLSFHKNVPAATTLLSVVTYKMLHVDECIARVSRIHRAQELTRFWVPFTHRESLLAGGAAVDRNSARIVRNEWKRQAKPTGTDCVRACGHFRDRAPLRECEPAIANQSERVMQFS